VLSIIIPSIAAQQQYAPASLALFALGMTLVIASLAIYLGIVRIRKERNTLAFGLLNMVLAFIGVISLLFSGFYVQTLSSPAYNETSNGIVTTIATNSISSQPLATNAMLGSLIYAFSVIGMVIGALSLLSFTFSGFMERRSRKMKKANE
jgi:hypothetical protein